MEDLIASFSCGLVAGVCVTVIVLIVAYWYWPQARTTSPSYARTYYAACKLMDRWHDGEATRDQYAALLLKAVNVEGNGTETVNVQQLIDATQDQRRLLRLVRDYLTSGSTKSYPYTDGAIIAMITERIGSDDE